VKQVSALTPTQTAYAELQQAFDYFNESLFIRIFGKRLPQCLITFQRHSRAYGFYFHGRFSEMKGEKRLDEIAMNPAHFRNRSIEEILSTLVHEMAHQYQQQFGKPCRKCYHNTEWANIMETIGLMPSTTGQPGGKRTGQKCSHYIIDNGAFSKSCGQLLENRYRITWGDELDELTGAIKKARKKNASNRLKYRCPGCSAQAWGKPDLKILCGNDECDQAVMESH